MNEEILKHLFSYWICFFLWYCQKWLIIGLILGSIVVTVNMQHLVHPIWWNSSPHFALNTGYLQGNMYTNFSLLTVTFWRVWCEITMTSIFGVGINLILILKIRIISETYKHTDEKKRQKLNQACLKQILMLGYS